MKTQKCDPNFVDVEHELNTFRSLLKNDAIGQHDFKKFIEPAIRIACDIYVRHPHEDINTWQIRLRRKVENNLCSAQIGAALQASDICWARLKCR